MTSRETFVHWRRCREGERVLYHLRYIHCVIGQCSRFFPVRSKLKMMMRRWPWWERLLVTTSGEEEDDQIMIAYR